ncbi:MAG: hypothetical protein R2939_01095 [Kofleriaceae bacterium]
MTTANARGGLVGLVLLVTSCLAAPPTPCADGTVCPSDQVCAPAGGCVDPDQQAACAGLDEGAACVYGPVGTGACRGGLCVVARCGDGVVDAGEVCDDGNSAGGDGCSATCSSDETCGNGVIDPAEACDCGDAEHPGPSSCGGTVNGDAACRTDCTLPRCGNGEVDPGEACDDGNTLSGDGCAGNCASAESCGNGALDVGEQCDDGNEVDGDGCQGSCQLPRCGDAIVDPGEACDDGNIASGDGCTGNCASTEACGNGVLDVGEQCDDDNELDGDGCQANCQLPRCGDGIVDATLGEACDDGAGNSLDPDAGCRPTCQLPRCGDGVIDALAGEVCDDGNIVPGDGCAFDCTSDETCGNGTIDFLAGETCEADDDLSHDGCSSRCRTETDRWTLLASSLPTPAGGDATYDARRGVVVFLEAAHGVGTRAVLQEWDGASWTTFDLVGAPNNGGQIAYDPVRAYSLYVTPSRQTWRWTGSVWSQVMPTTSPAAVGDMVFDASRGQVVLVNGSQTVAWTGSTWSQIALVPEFGAGPPRVGYDAANGQLVLFSATLEIGGDETFVLEGSTWVQRTTTQDPEGVDGTFAYDPLRQRLLYYDGQTWSWDGADWTKLVLSGDPPRRDLGGLVYQATHGRVLLLGGRTTIGAVTYFDTVHALRSTDDQLEDDCPLALDGDGDGLAGCDDPDCWAFCSPLCAPPIATAGQCDRGAPGTPYCGDGVCSVLETAAMCPADC